VDDHAPLIERAFASVPLEQSYFIEEIEGDVPDFIRGTYYLNGPARFARADVRYRHWLDGDGMVCALRFEAGRAHFINRFVRSAKFVAEEDASRPIFRAFGTAFASDRLKRRMALETPVNVSVYTYDNKLLAFGEQGLPWELDPITLETRGEFNFGGCLNDVSPFAAHPKIDPLTGEMFNFGVAFAAEPYLNLYRFDAQSKLTYRRRLPLDYACTNHDFGLSPNYATFYLSPYILDLASMIREGGTLMDSLHWEPWRGSRLLIVSRETGEHAASIPIRSRHCLHFINCFEEDGQLNIDVLELKQPIYDQYQRVPNLFVGVCEGRPVRYTVEVKSGALVGRREIDYRCAPDFPSIAPRDATRRYGDFWVLGISATGQPGRKFFDQLVHLNWDRASARDIYQTPAKHYLGGEPIFISNLNDEAEGVVICQAFDPGGAASAFLIFDAFNVTRGPVATLRLMSPLHFGFHASFKPDSGGESEASTP
jgi:all-trans-8'-apo-beta-carotenal 15,15'-oxygenase